MKTLICLAMLAAILSNAHAADDKATAKEAYREGTRQYDLGDFGKALDLFKKAYLNFEEPAILFNIAQCQRQLNNKPEAIKLYRSFLRKVPEAPNRADVEKIVARLESEVAQERATRASPPEGTIAPSEKTAPPPPAKTSPALTAAAPSAPERTPVYKKWWLWTAVGAVVVAGVGIGLGVGLSQPQKFNSTLNGFGPGMKSMALESP